MGTVNSALLSCYAGRAELEIDLITFALGSHEEVERFADNIRIVKLPVWNETSTIRQLANYYFTPSKRCRVHSSIIACRRTIIAWRGARFQPAPWR